MSTSFTAAEFARIGDGARQIEERAGSHEQQMETLLTTAEHDVALSLAALSRSPEVTQACIERLTRALQAQLSRSQSSVVAARRMCVAARENRLAVGRLASDLRHSPDIESSSEDALRQAVLVVDDHEDSRELVAIVLNRAGFLVRTASNGLEAIIAAYEMKPAVIVMDMSMPVLDGLEATRLIKAIDAIRDARVIAYTATAGLSVMPGGKLFAAVLEKPAPPDVVLEVVRYCATA